MELILKSKSVQDEFVEDLSTRNTPKNRDFCSSDIKPEPGAGGESQDGTNRSRRRSQELCLHFLLVRWTSTAFLHRCVHPTLAQGGNCREQIQTSVGNCQQISPFISLT